MARKWNRMKGERKRALGIRTEGSEFADDGQVLAKLKKKS
jgi:hypothetical protein